MSRASKIKRHIWTQTEGRFQRKRDVIIVEEPLEIRVQAGTEEQVIAVTMRTPGEDFELAAGFLYAEGVISAKDEVTEISYCVGSDRTQQEYNQLTVALRAPTLPDVTHLERHFITNSACGLCGKISLDALAARDLAPVPPGPTIPPETLYPLPETLQQGQHLFSQTGGLHAAALFDRDGNLLALREDVGRHNALDKLIGWGLLNKQLPFADKIIMVSGRASYELLQKSLVARAPILCAVSAPSSLAISLAERFNITLVGFLRGKRYNVYTGVERVRS